MAITHNANGIIVTAGTETWETVVTYNTTNALGLITDNGDRNYTLATAARIWGKGGLLTVTDAAIRHSSNSVIQAIGSGVVNLIGCQFTAPLRDDTDDWSARSESFDWSWSDETTGATQDLNNTTRQLNAENCFFTFNGDEGEFYPAFSNLTNVIFKANQPSNYPTNRVHAQIHFQNNTVVKNVIFYRIRGVSIRNNSTVFRNAQFLSCLENIDTALLSNTTVTFANASVSDAKEALGAISPGGNSKLVFLNPVLMPAFATSGANRFFHQNSNDFGEKRYSVRLQFVGSLQNVKVRYQDSASNLYTDTSDASGQCSAIDLIVERASRPSGGSGYTTEVTFFSGFSYVYRLYGYFAERESGLTITDPKGEPIDGVNKFVKQPLLIDPIIVASLATAATYTTLTINHSTDTVSTTGAITIRQFYDRVQWDLYQDSNLFDADWFLSADGVNFTCNYNLTLGSASHLTSSPLANLSMGAGKTLTLSATGTYNGFKGNLPKSAQIVVTGGGVTNLQGYSFSAATYTDTWTVVAATDIITTSTAHGLVTGRRLRLTTTGVFPTISVSTLATNTDYYVIFLSTTTYYLATTLANAVAGTRIDFTGTGTGTHTVIEQGTLITRDTGSATVILDSAELSKVSVGTGVTLVSQVAITASWTGVSQAYVSIQVAGSEVVNSGLVTSPYTYNYQYTGSPTITVKILKQGYSRFTTTFTPSATTQNIAAVLTANQTAYTGSSNAALTFTIDAADSAHKIRIGNASITAQQIYDRVEDQAITNPLRNNLHVTATLTPNGNFLSTSSQMQLIRNSAGDVNATVVAFVTRSDAGAVVDGTNGSVNLLGALSLTAQQVRDAMALAVTGGTTINTNSIDDKLVGGGGGSTGSGFTGVI